MTLRRKLLLVLLGFSLLAGILIDLAGDTVLRASLRALAGQRLERETALLAGILQPRLGDLTPDLERLVDGAGRDLDLRVTVVAADGRVLADSEVPTSEIGSIENHLARPEIRDAAASGSGRARRYSATVEEEMSYVALRLGGPRGTEGFVRLAVPTAALEKGGGALRVAINAMAIGAFLILSALAYALTRHLSAPVERLAGAADVVAAGRYDAPIREDGGSREIDGLAASLERMRRALLDRIRAAEEERRLLDTVLSGMREGLLAVDAERRVILANASLRRDLDLADVEVQGRPLAEVLRDPGVLEAFRRTLADREESRVALAVRFPAEKLFEMLVAPLDAPDGTPLGAVGLFLDVTRLQALERMRRDFIADVSHEMRTPLASLQAAVENLLGPAGADEADRTLFLGIVRRNAERMQALINDLTDLSLIETGAITLEPEPIALREMVRDVVASLANRAADCGVTIVQDVPGGLSLQADRRRLDQVLVNVVENAVKFNRPGGTVWIAARPAEGSIVVAVEDSGEGVAPGDLEKIFQRFYRRDRGRSREAGGTGLGLAIVKHLMRLHDGSVRAEPRTGGGTRIVLTFPAHWPSPVRRNGPA